MDKTEAALIPEQEQAKFAELLKAFQKLTDAKERRDFYLAHPDLKRVYSEVNFHI